MAKDKKLIADAQGVQIKLVTPTPDRRAQPCLKTVVGIFDDNDALLTVVSCDGTTKIDLPHAQMGRMVTVFHGYVPDGIKAPTPERFRRGRATEERFLVRNGAEFALSAVDFRRWRPSFFRVTGSVFLTVTSPDGAMQARPLCDTRITITEIDASISVILQRLPPHLLYRLRDHWAGLLSHKMIAASSDASYENRLIDAVLVEVAPERLRTALVSAAHLLPSVWTEFEWIASYYSRDVAHTIMADETGYFETELTYPSPTASHCDL